MTASIDFILSKDPRRESLSRAHAGVLNRALF